VCSISHDGVLAASLYLSRELANESLSLAAETETAADSWLAQAEVLQQVGKLQTRLLLDVEPELQLLTLAEDLGNLRRLSCIFDIENVLLFEEFEIVIIADAPHLETAAAGQLPLDEDE